MKVEPVPEPAGAKARPIEPVFAISNQHNVLKRIQSHYHNKLDRHNILEFKQRNELYAFQNKIELFLASRGWVHNLKRGRNRYQDLHFTGSFSVITNSVQLFQLYFRTVVSLLTITWV